ncbi:MAG: hypothetical protein Q8N53_17910 [Longimicrobiales bacterium]|nr:hypothetical protein [Longimicrobiales bacterium]
MEHLTNESLARLVDEDPRPEEAEHLAVCRTCAWELDALRAQTRALASLPEIRPPLGDWEVLEARLRSEGLVEDRGLLSRLSLAQTPPWMRAAAAAALFLGGTLLGAGVTSRQGEEERMAAAGEGVALFANVEDVEEAAQAVRAAEDTYVNALSRYRQLLEQEGGEDVLGDPNSRFAALEYLVAASQAAVRQAPADPFLNGLLASTLAERDVTLRRISTRQDNWF